ncbi:MAG: HAAS signaling domain-containing protein [Clostridia bacterium]|jgi:hypothetical protein
MELINRYIYAVTRHLPQPQREDIDKELRGLIEDMLVERCAGEEPQKTDIEAVLKELGEPSKLADQYRDKKRYLVGPENFDIYMLILKIVLPVTAFGVAIASTIGFFANPPFDIIQGITKLITDIISAAFSSFAWITIVFAINERIQFYTKEKMGKKEWDPSSLPEIPSKNTMIKWSDCIFGIVIAVLFICLFHFASQFIGVYHFEDGRMITVVPLFDERGVKQVLPLLTVLFCISILKECGKLMMGKWTLPLGIANAIFNFISLFFLVTVFSNTGIWNPNFINELYAADTILSHMPVGELTTIWNSFRAGFVYVGAFGLIIDAIISIFKGIQGSRGSECGRQLLKKNAGK